MFTEYLKALNLSQVGGKSICVEPQITTSIGTYSSGDSIGGIITLKDVMARSNGTAILKSILVMDNNGQSSALTILFFSSNPVGATTTDNSVFSYGNTFFNQIGKINIVSDDYETIDTKSVADIDTYCKLIQNKENSTDIYIIIIAKASPTYTAGASSLRINFGFLQD